MLPHQLPTVADFAGTAAMGQCTSSAVRDVLNADDVPAPVAKAPPSTAAKVPKVVFIYIKSTRLRFMSFLKGKRLDW